MATFFTCILYCVCKCWVQYFPLVNHQAITRKLSHFNKTSFLAVQLINSNVQTKLFQPLDLTDSSYGVATHPCLSAHDWEQYLSGNINSMDLSCLPHTKHVDMVSSDESEIIVYSSLCQTFRMINHYLTTSVTMILELKLN